MAINPPAVFLQTCSTTAAHRKWGTGVVDRYFSRNQEVSDGLSHKFVSEDDDDDDYDDDYDDEL